MILVGYINKIIAYDIDLEDKIEEYIEEYDNTINYENAIYFKIVSYEIEDYDSAFIKIKMEVEYLYDINDYIDVDSPILDDGYGDYIIYLLDFSINGCDVFIRIDCDNISLDQIEDCFEDYLDYI